MTMLRRYGHGHSVGVGFLLALALMQHALLFGVLVFAAGVVAGRAWNVWVRIGAALRRRAERRYSRTRSRVQARFPDRDTREAVRDVFDGI